MRRLTARFILFSVLMFGLMQSAYSWGLSKAEKHWSRSEFQKLVIGKTKSEIIAVLGRPSDTYEYSTGTKVFWYDNKTIDEDSGKIDQNIGIKINSEGVAEGVVF
jgi:outer membrane protein assembly factor BamE (lipoprotein component of BamABCDE complex)